MDNKNAIKILSDICKAYRNFSTEEIRALELAIKALKQEPCEDSISRKAVLDCLTATKLKKFDFILQAREEIKKLPSVTPVSMEKTGNWITKDGKEQGYDIGGVKTWYIQTMCSECGFIKTAIEGHTGQYHFCPNCGAKMVVEK